MAWDSSSEEEKAGAVSDPDEVAPSVALEEAPLFDEENPCDLMLSMCVCVPIVCRLRVDCVPSMCRLCVLFLLRRRRRASTGRWRRSCAGGYA